MVTPVNVAYTVASGVTIRGGKAAPVLYWEGPWIVTGDSLTDYGYGSNAFSYGFPKSGKNPMVIFNAGIQAQNVAQFVARLQATIDQFPAVQNYLIRIGTNSYGTGSYASQFQALYDILAANVKRAVMCAIPPKGVGTPGVDSGLIAVNQGLAALCAAHPATLKYISDSDTLGDANYNAIQEYYTEVGTATHPNSKGNYVWGIEQGALMAEILPPVDFLISSASDIWPANSGSNQWVQNPFMSGTSGSLSSGFSGVLPSGWNAAAYTTCAVVCSIDAAVPGDPNQTPWMTLAFNSGAAGNLSVQAALQHPAIDATVSAIKRYDLAAEIRFNNLNTDSISGAYIHITAGNAGRNQSNGLPDAKSGVINDKMFLRSTLPRDQGPSNTLVTPVAAAANTLAVGLWVKFNAFSTPAGSISLRCVSVRGLST